MCQSSYSTSIYTVLGELGRFHLAVIAKLRALRYWMKIVSNQNLTNLNCTKNNLWCKALQFSLDNLGFGFMLNIPELTDYIEYMVTQRLKDQFVQEWSDTLS